MLQPKFIDFRVKYGPTAEEHTYYETYVKWCDSIKVPPGPEDTWLRTNNTISSTYGLKAP